MTTSKSTQGDDPDAPTGTFLSAVNQALDVALGLDEKVFLLGEDISEPSGGVFGATRGLSTKYGVQRVRATPISEQAIMGASIGAAIAGFRPVPEIMLMNFVSVAMDQLVNHAAKLRYMSGGQTTVPLTLRTATGAGNQFGAQHSDMLESWFVHTPGLKVVVPSNPADAKGLLLSSIFDDDPVVFVEQQPAYFTVKGPIPVGDHRVPLGKANVARTGADVTIISYGRQVNIVLALAQTLDVDTILASVAKTKRAVVVHEAVRRGGFGAELAATIQEERFGDLKAPVLRVTGADTPIPYAASLEKHFLPQPEDIEFAIRSTLK